MSETTDAPRDVGWLRQKLYDTAFADIHGKPQDQLTDEERESAAVFAAHNAAVARIDAAASSLPEDKEVVVAQRILQEQLATAGIAVSLGAVQSWPPWQFVATKAYVAWLYSDDTADMLERPEWLPP